MKNKNKRLNNQLKNIKTGLRFLGAMVYGITFVCLFLIATEGMAVAQNPDEELFRKSIQTLASDDFGGRAPMSPYEPVTVNYIADQFKTYGLEPLNGDDYFQSVPVQSVLTTIRNNKLTVNGKKSSVALYKNNDFILWSPSTKPKAKLSGADLVFVGFGVIAPEYNWNDYADIDVNGKIVVMLANDPGYYDDKLFNGKYVTYYGRFTYKLGEANRQGAAGALIIHDHGPVSYSWDALNNAWGAGNLSIHSDEPRCDFHGWISKEAAVKIFAGAGASYDDAVAAAKRNGFKPVQLSAKVNLQLTNNVKTGQTMNVAGVLRSTDLKDEYILYSAHWDHLGISNVINHDSIYNGAVDNATGVSALFVIANRFHQLYQRPRRSIVFLAVTLEESGLLGSEYYVQHPLVPLNKTVVNLNMDCYGPAGRTHDVMISAYGDSETDRYVTEAAAAQGRIVKPGPKSTTGLYYRSDHFNFAKKGVPVIIARGGNEMLDPVAEEEKLKQHPPQNTYHQPSDEYKSWWDLSGTMDDIYLFYGIGFRLANDSYFPKWSDGIVYKDIREGKRKQ